MSAIVLAEATVDTVNAINAITPTIRLSLAFIIFLLLDFKRLNVG
jgi:hypothetical protein